jgi:hypothetical protein
MSKIAENCDHNIDPSFSLFLFPAEVDKNPGNLPNMEEWPNDLELTPGRFVGADHPTFIIAETGQNHQGKKNTINVMMWKTFTPPSPPKKNKIGRKWRFVESSYWISIKSTVFLAKIGHL